MIIYLSVAVFWPSWTKQGLSYQDFLWTSEWMKKEYPNEGFLFRRGQVKGTHMWERLNLGLPTGATTIDYLPSHKVIQGRVEVRPMIFNMIFFAPFALGLYCLLRALAASRQQRSSARPGSALR
ncbi:MAG: hypothetical protein V4662_26460 [Verrucomicrobiota bacterium]